MQEKKTYNPQAIESKIYEICQERGYFEVDRSKQKNFCIMMPPPNVTGVLHIGHALTFTLQDIITRYKRMDGYATLYQPGMDHAGIATQNIVEKQLLAQGISKESIGREAFIQKVWEWKEESGGKILNQMRKLGISPAWSRLRFTMDNGLKNAVKKAFVQWYEQGLIVQDSYMINWCTHDGALSDIEVEYKQNDGFLYHIKYPIKDSQESLIVATTRPETFFGDTAVMIHPDDERYKHLIGKSVLLPLLGREIPIVADSHVDMSFGTGCVKVTPAHDMNDYEVGKRHALPSLVVFDEKGILNHLAGEFAGLERLQAREQIVSKLKQEGFIHAIEPYTNQVGVCYRCGNIIEPYISKQWFVRKEVAIKAIERVNAGEAKFFPAQWLNNYNAWMRDLRPWCISRQLWWGHRIPVWYCVCGEKVASEHDYPTCPKCHATITTQDDDVLDTWFSSALWAFSTLGWGNAIDGDDAQDSQN
uniref:valine--tRNA ligase n=1 Tax=uncultured Helicobacter sp. TaxID=175537 RepID=UPI00374E6CF2